MEKKYIGFSCGCGTRWCIKPDEDHYTDVAYVKINGDVKWYMPKEDVPLELLEKIALTSLREKTKIRKLKEDFQNIIKSLKIVTKGTKEYFGLLHNYEWHIKELEDAGENVERLFF